MIRIQLGNPLLNNQYGGMAEEFFHTAQVEILDDQKKPNTTMSIEQLFPNGCVWKWLVPHCTQWFCWSLSLWKMAISLGRLTLFSDKPKFAQCFQVGALLDDDWWVYHTLISVVSMVKKRPSALAVCEKPTALWKTGDQNPCPIGW